MSKERAERGRDERERERKREKERKKERKEERKEERKNENILSRLHAQRGARLRA